MVPGTGPEVGERPGPQVQTELGRAVPQHLQIPVLPGAPGSFGAARVHDVLRRGRCDPEGAARVLLVRTVAERQGVLGVVAEADVGQPRPAAVVRLHPQRHVVVRDAEPPPSPWTRAWSSVTRNPSDRSSAAKAPLSS